MHPCWSPREECTPSQCTPSLDQLSLFAHRLPSTSSLYLLCSSCDIRPRKIIQDNLTSQLATRSRVLGTWASWRLGGALLALDHWIAVGKERGSQGAESALGKV